MLLTRLTRNAERPTSDGVDLDVEADYRYGAPLAQALQPAAMEGTRRARRWRVRWDDLPGDCRHVPGRFSGAR